MSESPQPTDSSEPSAASGGQRPWLEEQVYARKRQRTLRLVMQAVDQLLSQRSAGETTQPISLATIAAVSRTLDITGKGVSESAILTNPEARAYYEQHRTTRPALAHASRTQRAVHPPVTREHLVIQSDRNIERVRQRYTRMTKAEIVQRLLAVEQAYASLQERWLALQDECFREQFEQVGLPSSQMPSRTQ